MRAARLVQFAISTFAALAMVAVLSPSANGGTAKDAATDSEGDEAIDFQAWRGAQDFQSGELAGLRATEQGLRVDEPIGTVERDNPDGEPVKYEYGQWTSPEHTPGFDATELIASWNADTPEGTWLQVEVSGTTASGARTTWYTLGEWAYQDTDMLRTTVPNQSDAHGQVNVDTFAAAEGEQLRSFQLRLTLYRVAGRAQTPTASMLGAMTSVVPDRFEVPTSEPGVAAGMELDVPRYSQNVHSGHYPEFGGGGEVWCSPTSTSMVVDYFGTGPTQEDLAWIDPEHEDRLVDHAARYTYDYDYAGAGNWPFNTAYAAHWGLQGYVTRLSSLTELETYIARGIPVITSQSFLESELDGAGYGTAGHIMVVIGFTEDGDVIANDPASPDNEAVRRVYPRDQFENIWQRTQRHDENGEVASGPGGVAYIISPRD
ncbi:peptidase C39-like protein [Tamaricihabitans halophyticus]|uniref:Peptidase C39-like protein n=1 Tax=Tamaricihabitans halophyticus TaxID=1262583 RepID=A0A4R2R1X5_9PSEU|nr:C39 family peptidase [Tamaricihabitans halophyticus]TCP56513.1 peptidase C39-like protein [Tamaricihabitans halophyticus]